MPGDVKRALPKRPRPEEIDAARARVGATGMERLSWAIRFAQKDLRSATDGERYHLWTELWAFGQDASWEETEGVHREFQRIISELLRLGRTRIGPFQYQTEIDLRGPGLGRDMRSFVRITPAGGRGRTTVFVHDQLIYDRGRNALDILRLLLGFYANLVKACPAPKARSAHGEPCGTWFLANRPNQRYCSTRCQNRANVRAYREGGPLPPARGSEPPEKPDRKRPPRK